MLGGASTPICPIRLCDISGYDKRVNDVVYCPPSKRTRDHVTTVVFFGGDVQDFPENMQSHRENKNYVRWNLEATARLLHAHFPFCHVTVIRPFRMEYKTFSCFENFVPGNSCGAPEHTPTHHAIQHLERLLQGVSERLNSMSESHLLLAVYGDQEQKDNETENLSSQTITPSKVEIEEKKLDKSFLWWREGLNLDKNHLVLIGFSKGCVVLNQFLYEFHYLKTLTPDDNTMMRVVSRIQDMYWLDGGHSGRKNTWITSRSLLETLTRLGIRVHIHVTPYQINDERRPWIRKEEKMFSDLLHRLGAPVTRTVHFENVAPSVSTHFDVLTAFKSSSGTSQ